MEVQLNRSSANRAQVNRSPIKVRELPRYFSSVLFAPEDLALVRGEPAGRRRFLDELLVLRSPTTRRRVRRLRPGAAATQLPAEIRPRQRCEGTATRHPGHLGRAPRGLGSEIIVARADLVAALLPEVCSPTCPSPVTITMPSCPTPSASSAAARNATIDAGGEVDGAASATEPFTAADTEAAFRSQLTACDAPSSTAGSPSSGRTATISILGLNRTAGQGIRQPWRILVIRPVAEARVRGAAATRLVPRRPGVDSRRCVRRTGRARGDPGSPRRWKASSKCSSPPRCSTRYLEN